MSQHEPITGDRSNLIVYICPMINTEEGATLLDWPQHGLNRVADFYEVEVREDLPDGKIHTHEEHENITDYNTAQTLAHHLARVWQCDIDDLVF